MPRKNRLNHKISSVRHKQKQTESPSGKLTDDDRKNISLLWKKVLIQAIRDAGSTNVKTRAEVYKWSKSIGFTDTCTLANIQPTPFKRGLAVIMEAAENYPRVMVLKAIESMEDQLDSLLIKKES